MRAVPRHIGHPLRRSGLERPGVGLALPLDIRGTAFQERVWRALQAIPPGKPASYAEIAASIGPRAPAGQWRRPAQPIPPQSPYPAIASCARTETCPAIAGAGPARLRCWCEKATRLKREGSN